MRGPVRPPCHSVTVTHEVKAAPSKRGRSGAGNAASAGHAEVVDGMFMVDSVVTMSGVFDARDGREMRGVPKKRNASSFTPCTGAAAAARAADALANAMKLARTAPPAGAMKWRK